MKNTIASLFLLGWAAAASAEPGLLRAEFGGSGYDGSSLVMGNDDATVVLSADDFYTFATPEHTTYAYAAYMWIEGGVEYYFRGQYDDYATVKIDSSMVVRQGGECQENFGVVKFASSAWHLVEFRASNNGGNGGANPSYAKGGIWFKKGVSGEWRAIADSGDGSLFKTALDSGDSTAAAADYVYQYSVSGSTATIIAAPVHSSALVLPTTLDGKTAALGSGVFQNRSTLTAVTIPASMTAIDASAFKGCAGLTSIAVESGNASFKIVEGCLVSMDGTTLYAVPGGLSSVTVPGGVLTIPSEMFRNCANIRQVSLPSTLTTIGSSAFQGCSGLRSLDIPSSVTSIESSAFRDCSSLISITLPPQITTINSSLLYGCSKLESITIPTWVREIGSYAFCGCSSLRELVVPGNVKTIGRCAFYSCSGLKSVILEEGVERFTGTDVFSDCSSLEYVSIPASFQSFYGSWDFAYCYAIQRVDYWGAPPANISGAQILGKGAQRYPREFGAQWQKIIGINNFNGYVTTAAPKVDIVSSSIRENDPTILDVVYRVTSAKPTVKVRALAFEDGERSFAKVVRPETFIEGTATNIGDSVAANVEHTLSWQVSSDWATRLAKLKFEVLACEGELLPMEWMTIPATEGRYGTMKVSWNAHTTSQVFDALLWLYADKDPGLTLADGAVKSGEMIVASGTSIETSTRTASQYLGSGRYSYTYYRSAPEYVFSKMGYSVLSGDALAYVKDETRLGLSPDGVRQYAYKIVGDGE